MKYGRLFLSIALAGFLFLIRPTAVQAALTDAQTNAIATAVTQCAVATPPVGCFAPNPTGTVTYITAVSAWTTQLQSGTVPPVLKSYYDSYTSVVLNDVARRSRLVTDLAEWQTAHTAHLGGTTTGGTTTGGTTSGGTTTGGTTTTTTVAQGTLLSGMKKPSDYAGTALDTSNFIQKFPDTYGWSTNVWQTTRQLSNILIIVFLFLGALATTLNYNLNTYGIKRVLPSVVQAAILANFSYLLMNAAIEGVGLAQKGLLGLGTGSAAVNESTWNTLSQPLSSILSQLQPTSTSTILNLGWGLIAALGVAVAMLMLWLSVGILYLRSFVLAMLIAFAPIAILAMAFPATQGMFKKWWEEFTKWLLLPLIVCFWLMVAGLVSSVAALPLMLKMLVTMLAVFQGVKAPFSFKPAVAGAAIGYAAAKLTSAGRSASQGALNVGKDVGTRALYANNVTGGALRGYDRWKGAKSASLASLKDSKSVIRTPEKPTVDSSFGKRFMWHVGFQGRMGRLVNSYVEGRDLDAQQGQMMNERQQLEAQAVARSRVGLDGKTAGQRLSEHELQKERTQGVLDRQKERDQVAAAEANPELLRHIAELNVSKEALSNALESLKTGAKASALASDKNLQAEKKLSEFRKNEAANLLKIIEANMNSEALDENSELGRRIASRFAGPQNAALRRTMASYGVDIDDTGHGFVEGAIQNQVYADAATGAYESAQKIKQVNIAAQDSGRHGDINSFRGADMTSAGVQMNFGGDMVRRQAIAQHIHSRLKGVLTDAEMANYRIDDPDALAQSDLRLAMAINLYNNRPPHNASPELASRLRTSNGNQQAINRKQKKMVAEDIVAGSQNITETQVPTERVTNLQNLVNTIANPDGAAGGNVALHDIYASVISSGGREGSVSNASAQALTGTTHAGVVKAAKMTLKSLRNDAVGGSGGDPDPEALEQLRDMLVDMQTAVLTSGAAVPTELADVITNVTRLESEYSSPRALSDNSYRESVKKELRRVISANNWLNRL